MLILFVVASFCRELFDVFCKAPEGEFFYYIKNMKITKYYIDHAKYRAEDENGKIIWLDIDYWNDKFKLSSVNQDLAIFAKKLLGKKHREQVKIHMRH